MAIRKPLVMVDGVISQLPNNDTLEAELDLMAYDSIVDNDSNPNFIYKGWWVVNGLSPPAAADSVFRIQRIEFRGPEEDVYKIFAEGDNGFVHRWDQRTTLTYPEPT